MFLLPLSTDQRATGRTKLLHFYHLLLSKSLGTEGKRNREQVLPDLLMNALGSFPTLLLIVSDPFSQQPKSQLMGRKNKEKQTSISTPTVVEKSRSYPSGD